VPQPRRRLVQGAPPADAPPLLAAENVTVRYGEDSIFDRLLGRAKHRVTGAREVDLALRPGEILGIVGESGSGKSTIARALAGLNPYEGTVRLADRRFGPDAPFDRAYRRQVQIVFQNPDGSLNPRQRVRDILARPLLLYGLAKRAELEQRIGALLESVLLPRDFAGRWPHQLSGGEKQRVAIARAFAAEPRVVLCDEVTSSLDVSVQAQVVRLLVELQARTGCAVLFITHDINLVRQIAHRIAVMQGGECVDLFDVAEADMPGRHAYTRRLLEAVPALPAAEIDAPP
jgi:peptide/nickel transport system ATP-binding protein